MMLIGASLLTGILGTLCPKKQQGYLRLLSGLCMIALLVSPLPSYLSEADALLGEWEEKTEGESENTYEEIYHQTLSAVNAREIEETTKNIINQRFSTKNEDVSVVVELAVENENILLKKATVGIGGSAIAIDPRDIRACVESFLDCPCEIVYR